jgi:hypothetical protein
MTKFADQLFEDLMREHGAALRSRPELKPEPTPVRSRRRAARPAWLTAGLVTSTGAVAGGFVLFGGAAAPAYAVTQNQNGTVSVAVRQASAIDDANAKLKAIGVRAVVVPVRTGCPSLSSLTMHGPQSAHPAVSVSASGHDGQVSSITVDAKGVPSDEILVLAFESTHGGTFGASGFVLQGKVPGCVSLPAPPAGPGPGSGTSSGHESGSSSGGSTATS